MTVLENIKFTPQEVPGPEDTWQYQVAELREQVKTLTAALGTLNKSINRRIEWQDQVSPSGIQVQGLPVLVQGTLLGITTLPADNNGVMIMVTAVRDNGVMSVFSGPFRLVQS